MSNERLKPYIWIEVLWMLGQYSACSPYWVRQLCCWGRLPGCVQEGHHWPLAFPLAYMIFSEICLRLCYSCQFCTYHCSFQLEAQKASQLGGGTRLPAFSVAPVPSQSYYGSVYELICLKGLPFCLWHSQGKCSDGRAVENSGPVLTKNTSWSSSHLDGGMFW